MDLPHSIAAIVQPRNLSKSTTVVLADSSIASRREDAYDVQGCKDKGDLS